MHKDKDKHNIKDLISVHRVLIKKLKKKILVKIIYNI